MGAEFFGIVGKKETSTCRLSCFGSTFLSCWQRERQSSWRQAEIQPAYSPSISTWLSFRQGPGATKPPPAKGLTILRRLSPTQLWPSHTSTPKRSLKKPPRRSARSAPAWEPCSERGELLLRSSYKDAAQTVGSFSHS